MWPSLFGPGWVWGAVFALIGVATLPVFAWAVLSEAPEPGARRTSSEDPWHRYEEGDLTRREFERLRRAS